MRHALQPGRGLLVPDVTDAERRHCVFTRGAQQGILNRRHPHPNARGLIYDSARTMRDNGASLEKSI
jgi:hypothetical protein